MIVSFWVQAANRSDFPTFGKLAADGESSRCDSGLKIAPLVHTLLPP